MSYLVHPPKFGLAIDWETSGYTPPPGGYADQHQGLSFAAVIFDFQTFEPVEELYRELKFDASKYKWEAGAAKVHGLTQEHLAQKGVEPVDAAVDLGSLVYKYMLQEPTILLGHRVHFDVAFTKQLMDTIGVELNLYPTPVDSSIFGMVLMETPRSIVIFETMGLPPRGTHNALEDIKQNLVAFKRMKELFLKGVAAELAE